MAVTGRRERKVVSVLFADLVGFTSRAETLDPEDVEAILRPYHERLRTELERRGGTVEKFIGDAVVAVFGAPVAHEDDPERAVRAALAIRDWAREEGDLEVRIAVNTGEALVTLEPGPGGERGLVSGDVVNTASRLQAAAPVNGILVGGVTYNATAQTIRYREAPAVEAKGKAEPVPVWEAIEARSRFGADVGYEPKTALVGRDQELHLLVDTLSRVRQQQAPQLVTLVGVPGIGKSRLVRELFMSVDAESDLIYWRQGRCLPYGEGVAFWALGEILKAHAGILEGEPEERVAEKVRSVVDEAVSDSDDVEWVVGELGPLVGLGEGGEMDADRRMESFAAWRRFFEGLAELDPLVLVFEDLHWADEGLLDFIDHLVDWAGAVPILVVATARPELLARRAGWGGGKPNAATISLSPLTDAETARLVHALLDRTLLPAELQSALLERAGGNPLYAEEFARIATERRLAGNGGALPLPESVQGLIAARLDSLADDEKTLLQDAAIVGKVFWLGAVAALQNERPRGDLEERLHSLGRREFIRRERRSSVEGDVQYSFAHTLVRDVAYAQIPRADRAEKHRSAAAWIESLGRSEDLAELLAHHHASALDAARATGRADVAELERAARLALRDAGERAASLAAFVPAARHFERALALWPEDDAERALVQFWHARSLFAANEGAHEELFAARDALLAVGDRARAAEAETMAAGALWLLGRGDDVLASLKRAADLAAELPASAAKANVYAGLFRLHWLASRLDLAFTFGDAALAMADELGLREVRAQILNVAGTWRLMNGDRRGLRDLEESISLFEDLNSRFAQRPYNNLADTLYRAGDLSGAADAVRRMREAGERWRASEWFRWSDSQALKVDYMAGRWDEALRIANRLIEEAETGPGHYLEAEWRSYRSRIHRARGDGAAASADAAAADAAARRTGDAQNTIPTFAFHAWLRWSLGVDGFEELALEVVDECRQRPQKLAGDWFPDVAIVLGSLGRLADVEAIAETTPTPSRWLDGGLALAHGDAVGAAEIFRTTGARPNEAEARVLAAKDGLDADLPAAIAFFREVGAAAYLAEVEGLFQVGGARLRPGTASL